MNCLQAVLIPAPSTEPEQKGLHYQIDRKPVRKGRLAALAFVRDD